VEYTSKQSFGVCFTWFSHNLLMSEWESRSAIFFALLVQSRFTILLDLSRSVVLWFKYIIVYRHLLVSKCVMEVFILIYVWLGWPHCKRWPRFKFDWEWSGGMRCEYHGWKYRYLRNCWSCPRYLWQFTSIWSPIIEALNESVSEDLLLICMCCACSGTLWPNFLFL
jgi:hypothetical protein